MINSPLKIINSKSAKKPEISVLLPVFNGGEYLKHSLQSVLFQNANNFEFLIIDDCSTDGSFEYLKSINDERITLYQNEHNRGLFYNINFLISQSNSPLIKLWAQDDIMYTQCLQGFLAFHSQHPNIGFSYCGRDMIDEQGRIKPRHIIDNTPQIITKQLHARIAYYTGSIAGNIANVCITKSVFSKAGLFDAQMKISADFDMWVRIAEHYDTGFIKEHLIQLRDHDKQLSRKEEFYINHVKEDIKVYQYLDSYLLPQQIKEGHELWRTNKGIFYYTLMVKSLLKGNFKIAYSYFELLNSYENFFTLSMNFIRIKILKGKSKQLQLN